MFWLRNKKKIAFRYALLTKVLFYAQNIRFTLSRLETPKMNTLANSEDTNELLHFTRVYTVMVKI